MNRRWRRMGAALSLVLAVGAAALTAFSAPAGAVSDGQQLNAGSWLQPNHQLTSGSYLLAMQPDGNLVLYATTGSQSVLWSSGTFGHPGAALVLQRDGNLVLYSQTGGVLWANFAFPGDNATVVLQNDANLVEYSALGRPAWATNTYRPPPVGGDSLISGQTMVANDVLHSASRGYLFAMQPDGNVVIYEGARAVWWSGTGGHPGAQLSMQPDGNVVLYSVAGQPLWSTGTYGHPGSRLTMQPDGNVVVYSAANQPLWNTGVDLLSSTAWLAELNRYRAAAGIGPVVENNTWSGGLWLHLQYLTFTTPDYFVSPYLTLDTENPFSPTATTRGTQEAAAAGSYILPAPAPPTTLLDINRWFSAPFRAIGLMRPGLSQVGFATGFGAAAMDVRSGLANTAASAPILFPGPGVTTGLRTLSGDSPDPLESCPQGWTPPFGSAFGQALIALLPSAPQVGMQASVTGPTGSLSTTTGGLCMINENTYQSSDPSYAAAGASTLQDAHGVILIINQPYKPGTYTATITPSNAPPIVWSFNVS